MDLVKIPSPSWEEEKVIAYIVRRLKKMGLRYKKIPCDGSHNLYFSLDGSPETPAVLFSAHTDTVTPCVNVRPRRTSTRIVTDGTTILGSDDKAAIAMFLEALEHVRENRISHGPVEVLLTCAEEIGLKGIKLFDMSLLKSKQAFVFDCSGPVGKIIIQAPYHLNMNLKVRGRAAHAGIEPEKGINAINVLSEIITRLPSGRIDGETTVNIGVIGGGRATNIVAEESHCMLEIRSLSRVKMKELEKSIRDTAKRVSAARKARIDVESTLEYSGFTIKKTSPITRIVDKSMRSIGVAPEYITSGGGSDTNVFNKSGIRAVNLSCGMMNVHSTDEYIAIEDLIRGTRLVVSIIEQIHRRASASH
jgi:tripeptide aminopeptidase